MPKYIIQWDTGYGNSYDTIEANSLDEANEIAYGEWKGEAESHADYSAKEYNQELAEDLGLD